MRRPELQAEGKVLLNSQPGLGEARGLGAQRLRVVPFRGNMPLLPGPAETQLGSGQRQREGLGEVGPLPRAAVQEAGMSVSHGMGTLQLECACVTGCSVALLFTCEGVPCFLGLQMRVKGTWQALFTLPSASSLLWCEAGPQAGPGYGSSQDTPRLKHALVLSMQASDRLFHT